jgi:hypothetical protein
VGQAPVVFNAQRASPGALAFFVVGRIRPSDAFAKCVAVKMCQEEKI